TGIGVPPADDTFEIGEKMSGVKRIVPSAFHVPPRPLAASQTTSTEPPSLAIFFNFPSAKKPMNLPSADQNGNCAPVVSGSGTACSEPSERIQSCRPVGSVRRDIT